MNDVNSIIHFEERTTNRPYNSTELELKAPDRVRWKNNCTFDLIYGQNTERCQECIKKVSGVHHTGMYGFESRFTFGVQEICTQFVQLTQHDGKT